MKKHIAAAALVMTLAVPGFALARGWMGYSPQGQGPMYYQQMDQASLDKANAFQKDTQELRKQIAMKQTERFSLMQSQNPDPAAVAKVSGELFELQSTMQDKARTAGFGNYYGCPGGMGMGYGMMGGGGRGWGRRF